MGNLALSCVPRRFPARAVLHQYMSDLTTTARLHWDTSPTPAALEVSTRCTPQHCLAWLEATAQSTCSCAAVIRSNQLHACRLFTASCHSNSDASKSPPGCGSAGALGAGDGRSRTRQARPSSCSLERTAPMQSASGRPPASVAVGNSSFLSFGRPTPARPNSFDCKNSHPA